jgi:hypothetical protein
MLGRLIRDPLFAFALAGAALFVLHDQLAGSADTSLRLGSETRARLIADFEMMVGRAAGSDDIARLERDYIADELLFREALDAGMHLGDGVVRARLVEEMRYRITGLLPDPSEEQLVNHYAEHRERYLSEPAISFEHVYFEQLESSEAEGVLDRLRRGEQVQGDTFWQGAAFPRYGESMIRGLFGQAFVDALKEAPPGLWAGPLASSRGTHFVLRGEAHEASLLPFDVVRPQVENDFLVAAIQHAVDARIEQLRARYEVIVER